MNKSLLPANTTNQSPKSSKPKEGFTMPEHNADFSFDANAANTKKAPEKTPDTELYSQLYKNLRMGADSILGLLPKVKNDGLRSDMTVQLSGYDRFSARAEQILRDAGIEPKEENIVTKLSAKVGMAMNTMADTTSGHIAEMMIEGSTMGMTDAKKQTSEYERRHASPKRSASRARSRRLRKRTSKNSKNISDKRKSPA